MSGKADGPSDDPFLSINSASPAKMKQRSHERFLKQIWWVLQERLHMRHQNLSFRCEALREALDRLRRPRKHSFGWRICSLFCNTLMPVASMLHQLLKMLCPGNINGLPDECGTAAAHLLQMHCWYQAHAMVSASCKQPHPIVQKPWSRDGACKVPGRHAKAYHCATALLPVISAWSCLGRPWWIANPPAGTSAILRWAAVVPDPKRSCRRCSSVGCLSTWHSWMRPGAQLRQLCRKNKSRFQTMHRLARSRGAQSRHALSNAQRTGHASQR